MKIKSVLLTGMLLLIIFSASSQVTITFHVDVSQYVLNNSIFTNGMRIGGTFADNSATSNGVLMVNWTPSHSASAMTDLGNNIWSIDVVFPSSSAGNTLFYKYVNGDWGTNEGTSTNAILTGGCGVDDGFGNINRFLVIPASDMTIPYCYDSCVSYCDSVLPPPNGSLVEFAVDMNSFNSPFNTVYVSGDFNSWCASCSQLTDPDGDGIYKLTELIQQDSIYYVYQLDQYSVIESFMAADSCAKPFGFFTYRYADLPGSNVYLPPYCFDSCVVGCVSPYEANDECNNAITLPVIGFNDSCSFFIQTTVKASAGANSNNTCDLYGTNLDLWYEFTTPSSGGVIFNIIAGTWIQGAIYNSCGGTIVQCRNTITDNELIKGLLPNTTYILQLWTDANYADSFGICIREYEIPVNDVCTGAIELLVSGQQGNCNYLYQDNSYANPGTFSLSSCNSYGTYYDLWYFFTAPPSGEVEIALSPGSTAVNGAVYTSCNSLPTQCLGYLNNGKLLQGLNPGTIYGLQVWSVDYNIGSYGICIQNYQTYANDDCDSAMNLAVHGTLFTCDLLYQSLFYSTADSNSGQCDQYNASHDLWYSFVSPPSGSIRFEVILDNYDILYGALYDSCSDQMVRCLGKIFNGYTIAGLNSASSYKLKLWSENNDIFTFGICIWQNDPLPNDFCDSAISLPVLAYSDPCIYLSQNLSQAAHDSSQCHYTLVKDVWYSFIAPPSGSIEINLDNSSAYSLSAALYSSCDLSNHKCIGGISHQKQIGDLNAGQLYFLQIWPGSSFYNIGICLKEYPAPVNDGCAGAIPLPLTAVGDTCAYLLQDNTFATENNTVPFTCNQGGGLDPDMWYTFVVPPSGNVFVDVIEGSAFQVGGALYDSCGGSLLECFAFWHNDLSYISGYPPGNEYVLQVWTGHIHDGTFEICLKDFTTGCTDLNAVNYDPNATLDDGSCLFLVNFSVNMSPYQGTFSNVYVSGSFDNWCDTCNILSDPDGDSIWTAAIAVPAYKDFYYLYHVDNFSDQEYLNDIVSSCSYDKDGFRARFLDMNSPIVNTPVYCWETCDISCTPQVSVTFIVDMFYRSVHDDGVNIIGPWNYYNASASKLQPIGNAKYSITVNGLQPGETMKFKFINGDFITSSTEEFLSASDGPCAFGNIYGDRKLIVPYVNDTIGPVCFDECYPCTSLPIFASNDECTGAIPITVQPFTGNCIPTNGNTGNASASSEGPLYCGFGVTTPIRDLWYSFIAPPSGAIYFDIVTASISDGRFAIYDSCGATSIVACYSGSPAQRIVKMLEPGNSYVLRLWSGADDLGSFHFCLRDYPFIPSNDECNNPKSLMVTEIDSVCESLTDDFRFATRSSSSYCPGDTDADLWYEMKAPPSGSVLFDIQRSAGTQFAGAVFDSCNTSKIACFRHSNRVVEGLIPGNNYLVRVDATNNDSVVTICAREFNLVNGSCTGAIPLSCGTNYGTLDGAMVDESLGDCKNNNFDFHPGLWYKIIGTGDTFKVNSCGSDLQAALAFYIGDCDSLICGASMSYCAFGNQKVTIPSVLGETYYIYVSGPLYSGIDFQINMECYPKLCTAPNDLYVTQNSTTTVDLHWKERIHANNYVIRGNKVGEPAYVFYQSASSPLTLSGLEYGVSYFWQVQSVCSYIPDHPVSAFSKTSTFIFSQSCPIPTSLTETNLTSTSIKLSWNGVPGATYLIRGKLSGSAKYLYINRNSNFMNINGLIPGRTYEWSVKTICNTGVHSVYSPVSIFTTLSGSSKKEPIHEYQTIKVFPNPSEGIVNIQLLSTEDNGVTTISVYDMTGKEIQRSSYQRLDNMIQVDLEEGVYEVIIKTDNQILRERVVIID